MASSRCRSCLETVSMTMRVSPPCLRRRHVPVAHEEVRSRPSDRLDGLVGRPRLGHDIEATAQVRPHPDSPDRMVVG
jgi:hypothetical protein